MTPSITLTKKIILDDPRDLVCYVTLTVTKAEGISKDIFVTKYTPPISASDPGSKSFYNVAYVDQLSDLSTKPDNKFKPCFLLSHTVTKSFANKKAAETWCADIWLEIQRLLSTYNVQNEDPEYETISITQSTVTEEKVTDIEDIIVDLTPEDEPTDTENGSSSESSSESSNNSEEPIVEGGTEVSFNTIELTFDGKEIII